MVNLTDLIILVQSIQVFLFCWQLKYVVLENGLLMETDKPTTPHDTLRPQCRRLRLEKGCIQEKPISIPSNPPTIVNQHPDQTQIFARMEYAAPLSEPAIIPEEVQVKAAVNLEYEYDMGLNDDTPYYVRELIDGADYFNYSPYRFDE
ncbi:Hypothetical_protein [Hexamita inflata]|uniref:Hypothetical_protein n=1 Tax=Hexamita inflata TaxID=28002 RepID=A0AA86UYH1_9EUKA|nr:Hypothetical protein HINF_LOCUS40458 [Hexamita inflata]